MRFRQSTLKVWGNCALQAKFKILDGLPTKTGSKAAFGTAIHAALDHWNRTDDVEAAVKVFCELWDNAQIDVWNKFTNFGGLRLRGIDILRSTHDAQRWENRTVIASEHRFLVPFGAHELTGTVDLVELKRNAKGKDILRICDYKTNARRPGLAQLALDIQFTTYCYASLQREFWLGNGPEFPGVTNGEWWWETLQDVARRAIWVQLYDSGKEIDAGPRDDHDFGRLYTLCNQIEQAIQADVFVPSIGEACTFCDFANGPCPTRVPTQEEWQQERLESPDAWL